MSRFWVSEWLLLNANSAIFQLYHSENNSHFNEMMMSALNWLDFFSASSLKQQIKDLSHYNFTIHVSLLSAHIKIDKNAAQIQCLSRTLSKTESCVSRSLNKVKSVTHKRNCVHEIFTKTSWQWELIRSDLCMTFIYN
jgi:hypothetical protein